MLRNIKNSLKKILRPPAKEYAYDTLPWIDKNDADIDAFLQEHHQAFSLKYDLKEKLNFWQENGYVILENAIPLDLIDAYNADFEELITNKEKYKTEIRVDLPSYAHKAIQTISEVPDDILRGRYVKFNDFHNQSYFGKKLMLHSQIVGFLKAVFNAQPIGMQSLTFLYGSQQDTHQDFAYVVSEIPSHLAAAWIPLEDVHAHSGPLYYYAGSHKVKKFNFGNGILFNNESSRNTVEFANYLDNTCQELGLKKETLLIKKGDVLIWHSALVHGGAPIIDNSLTRKSYVCHYSSIDAYKYHRKAFGVKPNKFDYNGASVYDNPDLTELENSFDAGKNYQE